MATAAGTAPSRSHLRLVKEATSDDGPGYFDGSFLLYTDVNTGVVERVFLEPQPMTDNPTRAELDAKLEAVEARLETKLVSMDGKLDALLNEIRHVGKSADDARRAASNIKWSVLFTAVGAVAIVVASIYALWALGYQIADLMRPPTPPSP